MLAHAMVCVAIVAMAANAILSAGIISERIVVRRVAQQYAAAEYGRAADALFSDLVPYARSGAFPSPLPSFSPLPAQCMGDTCAMKSSATITLLGRDPPETIPCDLDSACAANEEANPYVREGRVMARVAVEVRAADGTLLAARENDVTVRTFATPPYLAIAGAADRTVDGHDSARGEDAGIVPRTPNPCEPVQPGQTGDTVVRVAYEDAQSGACSDGSSWRTTGY